MLVRLNGLTSAFGGRPQRFNILAIREVPGLNARGIDDGDLTKAGIEIMSHSC